MSSPPGDTSWQVQNIVTELDSQGTPQIIVLNKADAVAADPAIAKSAKETDWSGLHDAVTPRHIIATSARDGRGLEKLKAAVESTLLSLSIRIDCVLPYAESALLADVRMNGLTLGPHSPLHLHDSHRARTLHCTSMTHTGPELSTAPP